jgi:hypothetical protein
MSGRKKLGIMTPDVINDPEGAAAFCIGETVLEPCRKFFPMMIVDVTRVNKSTGHIEFPPAGLFEKTGDFSPQIRIGFQKLLALTIGTE